MEKSNFKIVTNRVISTFGNHLNQEGNHRIIFSAPFGTGKTTFLKDYFEKHKSEYQVFHLFPINYSVSSNEDIFELIKYDILFNFLSSGVDFEKVNIPRNISFGFFLRNNPENIIMPFLRQVPTIGKQVAEISEEVIKLYKKFELDHLSNQIDERRNIIDYLEQINQSKGSIKEEDFYTQLICELTSKIKAKDKNKNTVLIIDDLDRIDPDHIFRILNVFSAHFDHDSTGNKFGFDQIILVCDVNNIRKIYTNRYGQDVDFSGYLDKFYTNRVFEFNIIEEISDKLVELFSSIKLKSSNEINDLYRLKDYEDVRFVLYLIFALNKSGLLPIRKLLKMISKEIVVRETRSGPQINGRRFSLYDYRFLIVYQVIRSIFPDYDSFIHSLDSVSENIENNPYSNYKSDYLKMLIPFLSYPSHFWKLELDKVKQGQYKDEDVKLEWSIEAQESNRNGSTTIVFNSSCTAFIGENEIPLDSIDIFKLTKKTIEIIEKYKLNWVEY